MYAIEGLFTAKILPTRLQQIYHL
ncbi:hypothetical protein [Ehrlichia ruminantium]|nr:hypothetical protein [Ehrlichia ruminantium]